MKRILVLVLLFASIVPLVGFSPARQGTTRTLRVFWMRSPSDPQATFDLLERYATEFEAGHSGVDIELVVVDWSEGRDRIREAVNNGVPPDLAVIGARWVPEFVADGYIEPLDRYMTRDFRRRFIPAIINGAVYQGRTFGLPVAASTRALYYNVDIFEQADIEAPPETWDELLEVSKQISALGDDIFGFGLQGGVGLETNTYFYYFVWGNGGDIYNASNTASSLAEPEAVEALEFMQRLVEEGATQPNVLDYERRVKLEEDFIAGKVGMIITGSWVEGRLRRDFPDFNFGVAPIPYNTTPATYGVIDTLVMFKTTRDKDLAWEFLTFLYDDERRFQYVSLQGVLPELIAVAERPELAENPNFAIFLGLLPNARFEPLHKESEQIAQTVIEAVVSVYRGEEDPADALQDAVAIINGLLATTSAGW